MARLPDGWVFIPIMKDAITIELKQMELVTCQHCKHRFTDGKNVLYNVCELNHNKVQSDDWFCADGEEEDAEM